MTGYLALRKYRPRWIRFAGPIVLGVLLSASIEMIQIFTPSRDCSALDLLNNVIGAAVGILPALVFERLARPVRRRLPDRGALALLFLWIAAALFPLFPVLSLPILKQKLSSLSLAFELVPAVLGIAIWFSAGCLIEAARIRPARLWLTLTLLIVPAQFFVVGRQPSTAEGLGAIAGVLLFFLTGPNASIAGWALTGALLLRGLAPFRFAAAPQPFHWIPFGGVLETTWQAGIRILLEKAFLYGSAVWLLHAALGRWLRAAALTAALLASLEIAQLWLPGHTAEITDPLLALAMALVLSRTDISTNDIVVF